MYFSDTAKAKMIKDVPVCHPDDTLVSVHDRLLERVPETINYVYVVENEKLVGVFSVKEIFRSQKRLARDVMAEACSVLPSTDQEEVAILALRQNLKSIPVVDKGGRFLGVVPSDAIIEITHSELTEDLMRSAGLYSSPRKMIQAPVHQLVRLRLPWLILGLLGGSFMAVVTLFFEEPLRDNFLIAAFVPLIVHVSGAVGSQTQTIFIRNLSLRRFSQKDYVRKEGSVALWLGLILGSLFLLITTIFFRNHQVAIIAGISMLITIITAVGISLAIPLVLKKLNQDPALGTGPFANIISDTTTLIVYFLTAWMLLKLWY